MTGLPMWPVYSPEERAAVDAVLASGKVNYWTGQEGRSLEEEYSRHLGVAHSIALANGTVALELALRVWGIGSGDEVIVTPRSFIASTSCVIAVGATPIFVDVDRDSGNITAETIAPAITRRTKAIIPVHLGGFPCEMDPIMDLARSSGLLVLEDCAQAHGASYNGIAVGSIGDASAFSFCQDKIISTGGEGGLLATNDASFWQHAWSYKDHGKNWDAVHAPNTKAGFRWVHNQFGTNMRMTEAQAAIGRIQLTKLPDWNERRNRNAEVLLDRLDDAPGLRVVRAPSHQRHAYYRFYAYTNSSDFKSDWNRDRIAAETNSAGVPCFSGSCPEIYLERAFDDTPFQRKGRLPVARELGESSIALLVHPTLTSQHMNKTADILLSVLQKAVR